MLLYPTYNLMNDASKIISLLGVENDVYKPKTQPKNQRFLNCSEVTNNGNGE